MVLRAFLAFLYFMVDWPIKRGMKGHNPWPSQKTCRSYIHDSDQSFKGPFSITWL